MSILLTPWNFADDNPQFFAPNSTQFLRYETGSLSEIGMGGPLYGPCTWVKPDGSEVLLHKTCGGLPIWQRQGNYAALPIWKHALLRGWKARLGVVVVSRNKLILFRKDFSVLQLERFDDHMITATNSPIYHPKTLKFDISAAEIERIISL